jgi:hypothetical protein
MIGNLIRNSLLAYKKLRQENVIIVRLNNILQRLQRRLNYRLILPGFQRAHDQKSIAELRAHNPVPDLLDDLEIIFFLAEAIIVVQEILIFVDNQFLILRIFFVNIQTPKTVLFQFRIPDQNAFQVVKPKAVWLEGRHLNIFLQFFYQFFLRQFHFYPLAQLHRIFEVIRRGVSALAHQPKVFIEPPEIKIQKRVCGNTRDANREPVVHLHVA